MKRLTVLSLLIFTNLCVHAGQISLGNGLAPNRFPIYAPEPGNPYEQVFGNSSLSTPVGSTVYGGPLLAGSRYLMEFWAGPESETDFSGLSLIATLPFRTNMNNVDLLPAGLVLPQVGNIPDVAPGERARLAVRVWDTETGSDYDSAWIRGAGKLYLSAPLGGLLPPDGPPLVPPTWVGESFSIAIVPEPTASVLASFGAASWPTLRRRK